MATTTVVTATKGTMSDQFDPHCGQYILYLVCTRCCCTDVYVYSKRVGLLRSIWTTDVTSAKASPTICENCIDEFPGAPRTQTYNRLAHDVTLGELPSILKYVDFLDDTYTETSLPTAALAQSGLVVYLTRDSVPTDCDAVSAIFPGVNQCCMHDRDDFRVALANDLRASVLQSA